MTVFKVEYECFSGPHGPYNTKWRDDTKFVACITDDGLDAVKFVEKEMLKKYDDFRLIDVTKVCKLDFVLDVFKDGQLYAIEIKIKNHV